MDIASYDCVVITCKTIFVEIASFREVENCISTYYVMYL